MKILLKGANGFLGKAMQTEWNPPVEIITMGRDKTAMVICDLSNQIPVIPSIDMVVHIAAKILAFAGDIIGQKFPVNSSKLKKITSTLTFDDTRARTHLQWKSREVLKAWEIE